MEDKIMSKYPGRDVLSHIYSYDLSQNPKNLGLNVEDLINQIENMGVDPISFIHECLSRYQEEQQRKKHLENSSARDVYQALTTIANVELWTLISCTDGMLSMIIAPYAELCLLAGALNPLEESLKKFGNVWIGEQEQANGAYAAVVSVIGDKDTLKSLYSDLRDLDMEDKRPNQGYTRCR